jgi:hypothetical protein
MVSFAGSIDTAENVEYYYKTKEGSYIMSGKFYLDEFYNEGSVGLSVRSGLEEGDAMAAIIFSGDSLTFRSRESTGGSNLSKGVSVDWSSDHIWLQVEKASGTVTCRYSLTGEDWTDIGSIPFGFESSKVGLFSVGRPDKPVMAYAEFPGSTASRELNNNNQISAFINPAGNQLCIINPEDYSRYALYDLNGKMQLSGQIDTGYVDVHVLLPGMYVCYLWRKNNNVPVIGKLVIAR